MSNEPIGGWLKIHRKMLKWGWYGDTNVTRLFLHCLLKANYEDREWRGLTVERGSFVTSLHTISSETGLSAQSIRTAMDKLKSTGEITIKATNRYTIITVCKYDDYQLTIKDEQQTEQQAEQQTNNKQGQRKKESSKESKETSTCVKEERKKFIYTPKDDMSEEERRFCTFMPTYYPNICKMKEPLTFQQLQKLKARYSEDLIRDIMARMDNWAELAKKNISAYKTIMDWIRRG